MYKNNKREKKEYGPAVSTRLGQKTWKAEAPKKEHVSPDAEYYNYKAFRELQNVGNIETKADPNAAVTRGSYPYNIINKLNKVVDANYAGVNNIEGNSITRLQNSGNSKLLNTYDVVTINERINYLYLCYKLDSTTNRNNMAANVEMVKAFEEAASKGYSTMMTQLPFFTQYVTTDLPNEDADGHAIFTGAKLQNYHKLGSLLHYQTVLQNAVAPLSKYIQTRSLEQTVLNMTYRRESQLITQLYGQIKKAAFIAQLNAIGTSIIGEYFDSNWYKQMNTIMFMASRKSNDMNAPLETSTATTHIPVCRMAVQAPAPGADPVYYYNSEEHLKVFGVFVDPDTFQQVDASVDGIPFEKAVYYLLRFLDVSTLLTWARAITTNPSSVGVITSASAYYEQCLVRLINAINLCLTRFATYMTEIRTFIDKMEMSGLVYWNKGMYIDVSNIKVFDPDYNKILADLIAAYVGGSSHVTYDANTQRWQCWSLWNKYEGIPEFDRVSGGSFLTLGLRKLQSSLNTTDVSYCLPILFGTELVDGANKCLASNRLGIRVIVRYSESTVTTNPILSRLDPLNIQFSVKIPSISLDHVNATNAEVCASASALSQLIQTIAGYGVVTVRSVTEQGAVQHIETTSVLDPDYLCFLDVQIDDLSNEMIQYCRNYSPFRVSTPNGKRTIGLGN